MPKVNTVADEDKEPKYALTGRASKLAPAKFSKKGSQNGTAQRKMFQAIMSVNNIQNDFGANQSVFNDYKSDVSFFGESSKDNDVNGAYKSPSNTHLNSSLNPV